MAPLLIFTYPERPWIAQAFLALGFFDFIVYQLFGHQRTEVKEIYGSEEK